MNVIQRNETDRQTVILFHLFVVEKSSILDKAAYFNFMGSGVSETNTTTIGFNISEQVKWAYD